MSKVPIAEAAHALLSASGAERWLNCTPAPRLEDQFPESTSGYAEEGRLAHEIAELKLRRHFIEPMSTRKYNATLKKFQENPIYQDEMLRYTDEYIDYISSIIHGFASPPYIAAEKRLDFSAYVREGFGTGDCIIIGGETLHVIDFKYGKGVPVSAEENPQMKLYALGAHREYSFLYPISRVKMTIIQPRLDNISEYEMTVDALLTWGDFVHPIAEKAFYGEGEYKSGEWCRFCRAKSLCRARADFNTSLEEYNRMKPPLISDEEVGEILSRSRDLVKWIENLEEYALSTCLAGGIIPGWKAVEGRSNRAFSDVDLAFKSLTDSGTDEAVLYERKPITLTKVEDLLGKKQFNELLSGFIIKPPGKPTIAPEKDKRQAITNQITPEEAFGEKQMEEQQ